MVQKVKAIYKGGVFIPLEKIDIPRGEEIQLTIETGDEGPGDSLLDIAISLYGGCTQEDISDIDGSI